MAQQDLPVGTMKEGMELLNQTSDYHNKSVDDGTIEQHYPVGAVSALALVTTKIPHMRELDALGLTEPFKQALVLVYEMGFMLGAKSKEVK